jgi:hypothetical protein
MDKHRHFYGVFLRLLDSLMTGVMVVWVAAAVGRRNREIYVTLNQ